VSNPSSNRQQTLWAQLQSGGARTVNNSTGTWTSTGAAKLRYDSFQLAALNAVNTPTFKTGKRSPMIGVRGRQGLQSCTLTKDLIPSGAAGTAPDDDPILQAIMGAANVTVASTSVTYSLGEAIYYLFLSRYNKTPGMSSPTNAYVVGAVPQTVKFTGGGNFLKYEVGFAGVASGDSQNFASYTGGDAVAKGALTTYPAEPGSATQNGNVIPGFGYGAGFSYNGSALAEVRGTIEISIDLGIDVIADGLNDPYPIAFIPGLRQISLSRIQCLDSDGSVLNALKQASFSKVATPVTLVFGNVAGSIVTFTLNNVQAGAMTWSENGAALDVSFDNSMAHETSVTSADDMTIAFT
jgi:hypothetical protein